MGRITIEYKNIKVEYDGAIAIVINNRPDIRNALDQKTLQEMRTVLEELRTSDLVQLVIFTGAGEKSFAAGADIRQLEQKKWEDALFTLMQPLFDQIANFEKPTIAMINGLALGGGCELAMACDIRVASTHAKMGLPELNLGIIPSSGGTQRLAKLIGMGKAMDYILTGKILTAQEALNDGLITAIAPPERLEQVTREKAEKILTKGPVATMMAKKAVHLSMQTDMQTGLFMERLAQALLFTTEDKQEGVRSFLEKRPPEFKGR